MNQTIYSQIGMVLAYQFRRGRGKGRKIMGEPRICFDANVYQRALIDIGNVNINVRTVTETNKSNSFLNKILSCDVEDYNSNNTGRSYYKKSENIDIWTDVTPKNFPIGATEAAIPDVPNGETLSDVWCVNGTTGYLEPENVQKKPIKYPIETLPMGVHIVIGLADVAKTDNPLYGLLKLFYKCEVMRNSADTQAQICLEEGTRQVMDMLTQTYAEKCQKSDNEQNAKIAEGRKTIQQKIANGDAIWDRSERLIKIAREEQDTMKDIDCSELEKVLQRYSKNSPDPKTATLEGAEKYLKGAENLFADMVTTKTGALLVNLRGGEVQCKADEQPDSKSCQPNEINVPAVVLSISCGEEIPMDKPIVVVSEGRCVSAAASVKEDKREEIVKIITEGHQFCEQAETLLDMAYYEESRNNFKVSSYELEKVFDKYWKEPPDRNTATREEAHAYFDNASNMFAEMTATTSGALLINSNEKLAQGTFKDFTKPSEQSQPVGGLDQ